MLYFLAFAALPYLEPSPLILVEEPENGLHPARIAEVVRVLRDVSTRVQVVMATHSPLVINELAGDEVSVITRDEHGTHAVALSDTPTYDERASVYKNGEIWLAYGDGEREKALIEGGPAA
jgi:predicted ATPase